MNYIIGDNVKIKLPKIFNNDTVKEIIFGFFFRSVKLTLESTDKTEITIGNPDAVPFKGESVYSVSEKGVYVGAKDKSELLVTLFTLLNEMVAENLEQGNVDIRLPFMQREFNPLAKKRFIHLVVPPEMTEKRLIKLVKLVGVLGYTHAILEFWGSLKFDTLKELSWENKSLSKDQVRNVLGVMRSLGVEPVPMFQHFGHASACRLIGGKHVVLDQNPRLQPLFSSDGWRWNFEKAEVKELLKSARDELIELFGAGEYFHIGFDESFSYPDDDISTKKLCDHLEQTCNDLIVKGRTPILWGDLYLHEPTVGISMETGYEGNCESKEKADYMIKRLPKGAVVCDWQYLVKEYPWKSAEYFKSKGVNYIVCPWSNPDGVRSAVQTIKKLGSQAYLQTTWHYQLEGDFTAMFLGYYNLFGVNKALKKADNALNNATVIRKVCFADGDYESAGYIENEFKITMSR